MVTGLLAYSTSAAGRTSDCDKRSAAEIEVGAKGAAVLAERPAASTTVAAMVERITLRSDMVAPSISVAGNLLRWFVSP